MSRTLNELDREFPEHTVDPRDYAVLYHQRMLLGSVENSFKEQGLEELARIYELLKLGNTWVEISHELGRSEDALKHRFYRFRKKVRSNK